MHPERKVTRIWSWGKGLNLRHHDYRSCALPTELPQDGVEGLEPLLGAWILMFWWMTKESNLAGVAHRRIYNPLPHLGGCHPVSWAIDPPRFNLQGSDLVTLRTYRPETLILCGSLPACHEPVLIGYPTHTRQGLTPDGTRLTGYLGGKSRNRTCCIGIMSPLLYR